MSNPTPTTLRNHMNSITVGSVTRQDYKPEHMHDTKGRSKVANPLIATGRTHHLPFHLDEDNIFKVVGEIGKGNPRTKKRKSDEECNWKRGYVMNR